MKMLCNASDFRCVPVIATQALRIVQTGCVFDFFQCRSLIAERLVLVGENRQRSGTMPRCILKETDRKALGFVDHDVLHGGLPSCQAFKHDVPLEFPLVLWTRRRLLMCRRPVVPGDETVHCSGLDVYMAVQQRE